MPLVEYANAKGKPQEQATALQCDYTIFGKAEIPAFSFNDLVGAGEKVARAQQAGDSNSLFRLVRCCAPMTKATAP